MDGKVEDENNRTSQLDKRKSDSSDTMVDGATVAIEAVVLDEGDRVDQDEVL